MAHFVKVLKGKVIDSIVASQDFMDNYVDTTAGKWIQTSYNTRGNVHYQADGVTPSEDQSKALRKNYASKGMMYDSDADAFYFPQTFASWTLNQTTFLWEPPIPLPTGDASKEYYWDENLYQSDNTKGWVEVT